ncbi:isoaspartyl peptidase/L-asparaginase [Halobacterium sp. KA-4]|uniref:isoaspartyl peptidase/L-asparaginase n=1 Tax=Halobacterium sp. KA-4 TaxID=2896367 RepID=UPI001E5B6103|nr:isoaspartyl peptidase/L-asparaginase [Halobacterium sp. KA-4]MCD2200104.1 isoaspartyl peptidase/L-asparaginase [Halobacterium sp. KA-4]
MQVIVHGGAGTSVDEPVPRQAALDEAADAGASADDPVDAVEAAIRVLEADTRFNAGTGGAVQSDGVIRTDGGVMTSDRDAGAVASMPGVEAAVSVARAVMEETPHVLLNGVHAVDFAADVGVDVECDLWSEDTQQRWDDFDDQPEGSPLDHLKWIQDKFGTTDPEGRDGEASSKDHDTVGAVAFDGQDLAAATSTGGRWLALAGRVGDVPQIGSGFYAAPAGAASATGAGEDIAKTTLTRRAVRHLESGLDAQEAADRAIEEFGELTGSSAGVIVLGSDGTVGEAFNSEQMQTARARP